MFKAGIIRLAQLFRLRSLILLLLLYLPISNLKSQIGTNNITIRNDRVFMMNGKPYFPIGVCFELGENAYNSELKKPAGGTYGFNFINLFTQNANLYNCFHSRNVISGDLSSGSQYDNVLGIYWDPDLTAERNYERIKAYLDKGVYLIADDFAFHPDDYTRWAWGNPPPCGDDITINPPFNQQVRNSAIDKIGQLAMMDDSRVIGCYAIDDANMFTGGPATDPLYYYNNYKSVRIQNMADSYNHLKSLYPNSIVMMSLPATFFPRVFSFSNWQDVNAARDAWVNDAIQFSRNADVLFAPGYLTMEDPSWSESFRIYEHGYPRYYPQHIKETIIDRVFSASNQPKSVMGGMIFDIYQSDPAWNDPKMNEKVKWEIYVGLEKGATGLIFFGWHKKDEDYILPGTNERLYWRPVWDAIRHQVDTLVNIKHLDSVFVKTNLGQIGYTVSCPDTASDISYTIYKTDNNSWNDYYMLATNNPLGSLFGPDEGNKDITFTCNAHDLKNYRVTEVFSGHTVSKTGLNTFSYTLPWFGTAMFHITARGSENFAPNDFFLSQNYPNPFNPVTRINYGMRKDAILSIKVYDGLGRLVKTLVDEYKSRGEYEVTFDGTNFSSGIYFYKMKAGGFEQTKKMLIIK